MLLKILLSFSCAGFFLSLMTHLIALLGLPQPLGGAALGLHIVAMVVCLPAFFAAQSRAGHVRRMDFWKEALGGCPTWMRWLTLAIFGYALLNFAFTLLLADDSSAPVGLGSGPDELRLGSGHWMAFYWLATAIFYSEIMIRKRIKGRRCPNGHPVSPSAIQCEVCGARIEQIEDTALPEKWT